MSGPVVLDLRSKHVPSIGALCAWASSEPTGVAKVLLTKDQRNKLGYIFEDSVYDVALLGDPLTPEESRILGLIEVQG